MGNRTGAIFLFSWGCFLFIKDDERIEWYILERR
jgi:hypothetical protein